ncbi:MAG: carboxypeptidase regulatory-like domain-containing protein [Chloroflexi bacterium]|nr:carboxypeptidase regulatory-like domain-containing protein [Chloroflexota bacterium]
MVRFIRSIPIALILLMLGLGSPALAVEPDNGAVEGVVVNETQSGAVVPDEVVTLKIFLNDSEMDSRTAKTDKDGRFLFEGLKTGAGYGYDANVKFQEADYVSERVSLTPSASRKTVKVTVWDSTASADALSVESTHTIVYVEQGSLLVKSYAVLNNASNLTYIGSKQIAPDKKETLKFTVPPGASELQYALSLMECCVIPAPGSFSDTMPFLPGTKETLYTYRIPLKGDAYSFIQKFDYPTSTYDLLVQGKGIDIVGGNMSQLGPVTLEGEQFNRFAVDKAAPGDEVRVELAGLPKAAGDRLVQWLLMGLVAAAAGGGFFYIAKRRRPVPAPVAARARTPRDRARLVAEIARLDDLHEAGRIDRVSYRRQRTELKSELLKLLRGKPR